MLKQLKFFDFLYILFITLSVTLYFKLYPLNVDSTWILHCAKEMLNGSTLYVDMIDVNPPIIFIYSTVAVLFSKITSISLNISYIFIILVLIFTSLYIVIRILEKINNLSKNDLRFFSYFLFFSLTILISYNFGQREHLLIIFILPYFIATLFKIEMNIKFRLIISIFAALGFNIKPHFFLIFFFIEFVNLTYYKNLFKIIFRIEFLVIFLSGLIYLGIIYFYFPEYINFIVPFSMNAYLNTFNKPFLELLINYEFILFLLLFFIFLYLVKNKLSFNYQIIFISILACITIYFLQQKGWSYHRVPLLFFTSFLFIYLIIFEKKSNFYIVLIPIFFAIPLNNLNSNPNYIQLKELINTLPDKSSIYIMSTDIAQGEPLLKETQVWASRFPSLFMLNSINSNAYIKKYTFESIYEDLKKYNPQYLIFPNYKNGFDFYNFIISNSNDIKNFYKTYYKINYNNYI